MKVGRPLLASVCRARRLLIALVLPLALIPGAFAQRLPLPQDSASMKIRLVLPAQTLFATLQDSPAARDFYRLLPLKLTLEDYAATEKIAYPPRKLDIAGEPEGHAPAAGDLAYYAPWGNLALFHKGFRYSSGLVKLGRIESDLEPLRKPGKVTVSIERAD